MATLRPSLLPPPPPPDAAEREKALNVTASFLVRAPAGSGKTELLVQRFLKLLPSVDQPEAIVAATFSRKAAAEMRARVLSALSGGLRPDDNHPATWEWARPVREQLAARGWDLAATPARLRITTLDSLALSLAARMPWLSRLGPAPQPTEEAGPLYRAATHATLTAIERQDAHAEAARALLLRFDNNAQLCEEMLAGLLEHRDQWLALVQRSEAEQHGALAANFQQLLASWMCELRAIVAAETGAAALPPPDPSALPAWQSLAKELLTDAGTLRKRPPARLALGAAACAALQRLSQLPAVPFDAAAWQRLLPVLRILPRVYAELKLVFRERGQCDFTEVTLAACHALQQEGAPTALAFALDARLRHLLLDEFQDTSAAQFQLVQALVADWQPGDGRTLFAVGDPMQSIYGWRAARVDLFLGAAATLRLEPLALTANFRSHEPLVTWTNAVFSAAFPPAENALAGSVSFHESKSTQPSQGPAVEFHPVPQGDLATEAGRVADLVQRELSAGTKEIAILVAARSHLQLILPALRRFSFLGRKLAPLAASSAAADLLAIARALLNPADRVAWLALLRAPWCGLRLADLHALAGGDAGTAATLTELWSSRRGRLSSDGQARAERVFSVLAGAAAERVRQPLRILVEWCWRQLAGPQCLRENDNPADAFAVLEYLQAAEAQPGGCDPAALELALERIFALTDLEAKSQLQIMTIHEAKGLEFDVVILPGLARATGNDGAPLLHWLDWPGPDPPARSWALAARSERNAENPGYTLLAGMRRARAAQEDLRQLYVAATRARRRLHLVTELKLTRKREPYENTPLEHLWKSQAQEFLGAVPPAAPQPPAPVPPPPPPPPPPLRRLRHPAWAPPAPVPLRWRHLASAPPPSESAALHHAAAFQRRLGIALHAMLQFLAGVTPLRWDPQRLEFHLYNAGFASADMPSARAQAAAALNRTLADPRGRWILAPHDDAHSEWALTSAVAGVLASARMDRSFVENGIRWIIDYKLASHAGTALDAFLDQQLARYKPQLSAYAGSLSALLPHPNIRCGLYFPLLSAWREWVPN
ncbi:MAG: UvrD-helicase domain-containing protein [Terriglobales bacterium]